MHTDQMCFGPILARLRAHVQNFQWYNSTAAKQVE